MAIKLVTAVYVYYILDSKYMNLFFQSYFVTN